MPITIEQMTLAEMEKIVKNPRYKCGECGGALTLAWGGSLGYDNYIVRCGNNVAHNTVTKYNRKEEEFMAEVRDQSALSSTSLVALGETGMLERVEKAKFPKDLTAPEKRLLAAACVTYGFDPIMHELTIYQGDPFVSVDGRYRKAQETGFLDGMSCRPATREEKEEWEIPDGDKFFRAECYRKDAKHPFVGWGRVTAKEISKANEYTPIATNPQRMAEKRAEVQALRKAFHIPLPSSEYIGVVDIEGVGRVIEGTGEIVEKTETSPEPERIEEQPSTSIVNLDWLKESVKTLVDSGQTAYSDESLLSYMRSSYKGVAGDTYYEIASKLDKGEAKHFTNVIQDALAKA